MTFVEWQMIAFFGNIGLPKQRPNSGHASPRDKPNPQRQKERGANLAPP
jgi:hypothetical protein